jgi:acetylornithine deacetylase
MNYWHKKVIEKVDTLEDYLITTTQELIRIPSINHPPTGDEYQCQIAVAKYFRDMGIEPDIYYLSDVPDLKKHPSYWPGRNYSNRPNVTAKRNGTGGGRSLILSGHIDTVPIGTKEWHHDPFGAEIDDGKMYGLGSYDMKAGVVINLGVIKALQELDIPLKGDLSVETVVDEEFGGVNGTLAARLHGEKCDAVIITEPTNLVICNGGRGGQVAIITLEGPEGIIFSDDEPGHAIRELAHFLKWVDIFRQRRRDNVQGWQPGPLDPIPVWITKVNSGGWGMNVPLTIPAEIKLELYWQLMPGEEKTRVREQLFNLLDEMVADKPNDFTKRPNVEFPVRFMPGSEIPIDAPLVQYLKSCATEVMGISPEIRPMPAPSDMFVIHLDFNTPAVHFGIGGGNAHAADEFVIMKDLVTATKTLALLALDWCGVV